MMKTIKHFSVGHGKCLRVLSVSAWVVATIVTMAPTSFAGVVTFGSGVNAFTVDFVTIGNPGNAADTTGSPNPAGAVAYVYGIGKFEVSEDMVNKFNASQSLQITMDSRGANKPATSVSWNEAARFVNWLNTSKGGFAAYKFTTPGVNDNIALWTPADKLDYDPNNRYRSKRATYALPRDSEWYKAAYYNPNDSTFYDFTNGRNTAPTPVAGGVLDNTAVYGGQLGPVNVDQAGGLSPYGVMGLGGNVFEWEERSLNLADLTGAAVRGVRGGFWGSLDADVKSSTVRGGRLPGNAFQAVGFRVVDLSSTTGAVPEPSMMVIGMVFGLGGLMAKRQMPK
jgi:sulfatase modifying factor 1